MKISQLCPQKTVYELDNGRRYLVVDTMEKFDYNGYMSGGFEIKLFNGGTWEHITNCSDADFVRYALELLQNLEPLEMI